MVVGICQTDLVYGDKNYNLITLEDFVVECSEKGARLVLFPEMSATGYTPCGESVADNSDKDTLRVMSEFAEKYNVAIGFGYVLCENGEYTNRYAIVDSDKRVLADYAKIHPFSLVGEDKNFKSGEQIESFTIDGVKVTPFICYDLRFPTLFQAAAKNTDLFVVAANWPAVRSDHFKVLLQARAIENQAYVIGINRVGDDGNNYYMGDSMIIDPKGQIVDVLDNKAGILIIDIDADMVKRTRQEFPSVSDMRPELYRELL